MRSPTPDALLEQADFLRRLARGLLGDAHAAEDAAQEAWIVALDRPSSAQRNPSAWRARVAERLARRMRRGARRRARREALAAREERVPSAFDLAAREESLRRVTDAVLALEEPYRATILLRYYEGLDVSAIAEATATPLATVKSRLQRSHAKLRERLDRAHGGEREAWAGALVALLGDRKELAASGSGAAAVTGGAIVAAKAKLALAASFTAVAVTIAWKSGWFEPAAARGEEVAVVRPEDEPRARAIERDAAREFELEPPERAAIGTRSSGTSDAFASLELAVRFERTGDPAADCELRVSFDDAPCNERLRRARTDAEGTLRLDALRPGHVSVRALRGSSVRFELAAGERARGELAIPKGLRVLGRVVDEAGEAVCGAELWLSVRSLGGGFVGASRPDGSFELVDVPEDAQIAAVAPGRSPSHAQPVIYARRDDAADEAEIELVLTGEGGGVALSVVDTDGAPVPDAYVRIEQWLPPRELPNHLLLQQGPTIEAWTDAEGRARIEGLKPGSPPVKVLARGLARHRGSFDVRAGELVESRIVLAPQATVAGTVTRADGSPAAGASIALSEEEFDPLLPMARAGADGSYELGALPIGRVELRAGSRDAGSAKATLELAPGETGRWDPVLALGRIVTGRVLDERGGPLAGWTVSANAGMTSRWHASAKSDAGGAFRFTDCASGSLELQLFAPEQSPILPALTRALAPDEDEVELRIARDELPECSLAGRVLDEAGEPAHGSVSLWRADASSARSIPLDAEGRFAVERIPPGRFELIATMDGLPRASLALLDLRPRERLDLGELRLDAPGRVRITVGGAAPSASAAYSTFLFRAQVDEASGRRAIHTSEMAQARDADLGIALAPGRYRLRAHASRGFADEERELEVRSGEETLVDLQPREGRFAHFEVVVPDAAALPERVRMRLFDEGGREFWDTRSPASPRESRRFGCGSNLRPGFYTLEAESADGRRASARFEVVLSEPEDWRANRFELELR